MSAPLPAHRFSRHEFFAQLMLFRGLMGDRTFWAKPPEQRDSAVRGFGFVYTNSELKPEDIGAFCSTMTEYTKRESMMCLAGLCVA